MKTHEELHTIRYSEGDRNGFLKLRALFDYAQDIAGNHAEELGVGMSNLRQQGRAWMLSRIRLRILRHPKICETLRILTYPMGFQRLFARREFRFYDQHEQLICAATSYWLLLELPNLRILNAQRELEDIMPDNGALDIAFTNIDKIQAPTIIDKRSSCHVEESMLDINQHLNNAEYAALVQNFLSPGHYPAELQLNYQLSVPPAATLEIAGHCTENDFLLHGCLDGQSAFQATGIIRK